MSRGDYPKLTEEHDNEYVRTGSNVATKLLCQAGRISRGEKIGARFLALGLGAILFFSLVSMPLGRNLLQDDSSSLSGLPLEFMNPKDFINSSNDGYQPLVNSGQPFITNQGQHDAKVRYYTDIFAGTVYVTDDGLTYALRTAGSDAIQSNGDYSSITGVAIKESFMDSKSLEPHGRDPSQTRINYFVGDQSNWKTNIPAFNKVSFGQVWNGVDVELVSANNNVEKIFTVAPGADVSDIQMELKGVTVISINNQGELVLGNELGEVIMTRPVAFQEIGLETRAVEVSYVVGDNGKYGFAVGSDYDPDHPLIIDPLLASTYIGGTDNEGNSLLTPLADDEDIDIALDSAGNVFITGLTSGTADDYPNTVGPYGTPAGLLPDAVISKFNSDLSSLLASTVIGGGELDEALAIAIDSSDNIYITGRTNSTDFPTTGLDTSYNGGLSDAFVSKLSNDLSSLFSSTFIGGTLLDQAMAIAIDATGDVYVVGDSFSTDYPTTSGAYDAINNLGGGSATIVTSLNMDTNVPVMTGSTFIEGNNDSRGRGVAFDSTGNVYVVGHTLAANFPIVGGYDTTKSNHNQHDTFVAAFNSGLTGLLRSTYHGNGAIGGDHTTPSGIVVTPSDKVYIAGFTRSSGFPTTSGVHDGTHNGLQDAFISVLPDTLDSLLASTVIGGDSNERATGLAVTDSNVYITARGGMYPTTPGAYNEGANNAYVSRLDLDLTTLLASTSIGGSNDDSLTSIAVDPSGDVYVVGQTKSTNYPTTPGAYDTSKAGAGGSLDFVVSKFTADLSASAPSAGGTIAFASNRDGNFEIYVMEPDGTGQTRLTNDPSADEYPSVSPDGSQIAFTSNRDGNREIYVMNADGTGQTNLSNNPFADEFAGWSPDGSQIAFTSNRDGDGHDIYVMNADGTGQTRLTNVNFPAEDNFADWSPDGSQIAFTSTRDGNREIYVMNADGTVQIRLTNGVSADEFPSWSPDGSLIAFDSGRDGNQEIYVMNADGTGQTRLTNDPSADDDPSWSPDGSAIAFASIRDGNAEIYVMNADGTVQINRSNNAFNDALPDWGPDLVPPPVAPAAVSLEFVNNVTPKFDVDEVFASGLVVNDLPGDYVEVSWGDGEVTTITPIVGGAWGPVSHIYGSAAIGQNTLQPFLFDSGDNLRATGSFAFVTVSPHSTVLGLNPLRDVTATTGYTVSGNLTDDDTGEGISGQMITFTGTGVTPSLQSVMTEGVTFTGTIDLVSCLTPVITTPTTCTTDDIGTDSDTSDNIVLHLGVGDKIMFPASTVTAKIYLQDMGTTSFKYIVEEGNGALQLEATSAGALSPIVPKIEIVSGYSPAGDPNGIKELTITEITGGASVGIAAVLTGNPDGLPVEQHQINFEEFTVGPQLSPFTVNPGFYFSTGFAQNVDEEGLDITAHFGGAGPYAASDSTTETYNVLANTAGLGGEGSQNTGQAVGTSITSLDCNTDVGSVDTDNDGICDLWETSGITFGGANYPLSGAVVGQKDIFVELDCMAGFCPTSSGSGINNNIQTIINVFAAEGFVLHISVDENNLAVFDPLHVWNDGTPNVLDDFDSIKKAKFGTSGERSGGTLGSGNDFLEAKAQVYHYGLFAKNINALADTSCGPSGQAELRGNDFIVSVGCTTGAAGTTFANSHQERVGTLMHELGHNLGLRHGGGDDDNCKPNLISVMSYSRQFPWGSLSATTASGARTEWSPTYSRQDLADLNENNLQESNGLTITTSQWNSGGTSSFGPGSTSFEIIWGRPAVTYGSTGASVNWNNAGGSAETLSININTLSGMTGCSGTLKSTLASYDEWSIMDLNFRDEGSIDGLTYPDPDTLAELTPPVLEGAEQASIVGPNNVFNNPGISVLPDVATDAENNIYVVWSEKPSLFSGNFEILFSKSVDGGATFSVPEIVSNNAGDSLTPRIAVSNGILYVVWSDKTGGTSNNYDIRFSKSSNMGEDWDPSTKLSSNSGDSLTPSIAASGSSVYVVWSDKTGGTSNKFDIQFKKSDNGGTSFTPNTPSGTKVSSNSGESLTPDVDVSSSGIFVVWSDTSGGTSGNFDILFKKSTDGGTTFLPNTANAKNVSTNGGHSLAPSLAVEGDNVYVTWSDTTGGTSGNFDILFKKSVDGGANFTPNTASATNISTTSSLSASPRIAVSSGSIYIAWSDIGTPNQFDIFAKKSGDSGENFEAAVNISANTGQSITPAIALTDVLHLVWGDLTPGITGDIMYASRIV